MAAAVLGFLSMLLPGSSLFSASSTCPATAGSSCGSAATEFVVVAPVLLSILAVMLVVTLLTHMRHALGSTPIPASVPLLAGGLPLVGHAVPALRNYPRLHDWLYEITQQMGEGRTYAFSLPLLPSSMVVTDPRCLEYVLKHRAYNFTKGNRFFLNFGPILGHGIFTADGPDWYWQRKLATNIFSVKSFKQYIDTVFGEKMNLLTEVVGRAADNAAADAAAPPGGDNATTADAAAAPLDLHDLMYRFTLDSFGQIGFGVDPGCLKTADKVPFAAAFDSAQVVTNARFWQPAWFLLEQLDGSGARLHRDVATIKSFALDIITQRRKQLAAAAAGRRDQGPVQQQPSAAAGGDGAAADVAAAPCEVEQEQEEARDLLSLFMAASGPDGKPLTTPQLIDTVINFIIAGRDTTAQALSWTFYLLMQHPEVEAKLLQEIEAVLGPAALSGGDGSGSSSSAVLRPSYDQLRSLRYARAVFLEALRLYPSVPENAKYAVQRDVLPDGTVVPAGTQIIYSPYVVNRLASVWGPDATVFRPERWVEMDKSPSPYSYLTFNAGPRLCLGQRLAELEGVFVLTGLLARFKFRPAVPGAVVTYNLSPTMPMKGGLQVVAEHRRAGGAAVSAQPQA